MYSFMAGGLFCASVGNILLVVCTATDYWVQYRLQGALAHQGLWRYCLAGKCYMQMENIGKDHWGRCAAGGGVAASVRWASRPLLNRSGFECFLPAALAYWNATRAFMILSALSCFAGIITGILSFAHRSTFEKFNRSFAAGIMFFVSTLFVLLAMAVYTGVTVNFLGKRFGDWRFSWSYILGWVALLMTFFAGIFYMCAYRMHGCQRVAETR
ncbi:lens fiber membrane intrinsic protein-like isoform X1 [Emys orbicularis]|uniref:lens fiber membrane intrinsic protein-like isoform X1 n=1 Tax=Emys orbicularis TaxID=82168 RepID=UPI0031FD72A2